MATINSSIILISLPAIFKGIGVNPLSPSNVGYLLWLMMGYQLVTAVLVVSLGRLGDLLGRVRIYNLGFAVFAAASIALALDPYQHAAGAIWLLVWRFAQGIGGAMLLANSSAILTDAFPQNRRGFAIGINQVAAIAGSFIGLIVGGILAVIDWHAVFWVSVPFGLLGTIWAYFTLKDTGKRGKAKIDWLGNATFAVGLTSLLTGIVYGIQPYKSDSMGWRSPDVIAAIIIGLAFLLAFLLVESKVSQPMFDLQLFRIRAFSAGSVANLLSATARGGMQFMLIIWLQGIWLPMHGFSYDSTPLWSAIYLLPLSIAFLIAGPLSGFLSDRHGARALSTAGMVIFGASFVALMILPVNFNYWAFGLLIFLNGVGGGMFSAPNQTAIMNSVPANQRGGAAGIQAALMNSGMVLSMGLFFSMMIVGLANSLPANVIHALTGQGVNPVEAHAIGSLPPAAILFSSFLGYNPMGAILGNPAAAHLSANQWITLTSKEFFPRMIQQPFHEGLGLVFGIAAGMALIGAVASMMRGKHVTANSND
ncbi:MAG: hypothetical protein RJA35_577 [Actinomycetota bacterium]